MTQNTESARAGGSVQLNISSTAFRHEHWIPRQYTCDGINISPPLDIANVPPKARSLVLIVDDPDAPVGTWVHWLVWNIPVANHINENEIHGTEGISDFLIHTYSGPCPPSGMHRYFFKVYALDTLLDLPVNTKKAGLEITMNDHIIGSGELIGLYKRPF